ncbi:hypothetical protein [Octadecabacter antarcticus]|uniref:hypothetical protein n=1 Tax=Octadecabacter antarcticus TaxID=1217908 RepID=UPI0001806FF2|nr:hypothetical protein [Octadecabacter antarcticus]
MKTISVKRVVRGDLDDLFALRELHLLAAFNRAIDDRMSAFSPSDRSTQTYRGDVIAGSVSCKVWLC